MLKLENQQQQEFNKEEYLERINKIIYGNSRFNYKIDIPAMIFGSFLVTIPFISLYYASVKIKEESHLFITDKMVKYICTDKYGVDENGMILNSAGFPKNPQTADDLPEHDITFDMIVPSPIDQHGTYGSTF